MPFFEKDQKYTTPLLHTTLHYTARIHIHLHKYYLNYILATDKAKGTQTWEYKVPQIDPCTVVSILSGRSIKYIKSTKKNHQTKTSTTPISSIETYILASHCLLISN